MAGYVQHLKSFRKTKLYQKSSVQQREVLWQIMESICFETNLIDYGGQKVILEIGQIWLSQTNLEKELSWAGVTRNHVRNTLDKLVSKNYLSKLRTSRVSGSIYKCLPKFYAEIAEPFNVKKLTNHWRTTDEPLTNHKRTIDERNNLKTNNLKQPQTNHKRTISEPLANHWRTIDDIKQITNNKETMNNEQNGNGNNHHFEKNNLNQKKVFKQEFEKDSKRKKVAAKKEIFPPAPVSRDPIDIYFESENNLQYWQRRYLNLDVADSFKEIREALFRKAAKGNTQMNNFYSYVKKCLDNQEIQRVQKLKGQSFKNSNHGKRKSTKAEVSDWAKEITAADLKHGTIAGESWYTGQKGKTKNY